LSVAVGVTVGVSVKVGADVGELVTMAVSVGAAVAVSTAGLGVVVPVGAQATRRVNRITSVRKG
jgi:hypothetical protein